MGLVITMVYGEDFDARRVCPPLGWNPDPNKSTKAWEPPAQQDLFIVLTQMEQLDEDNDSSSASSSGSSLTVFIWTCMCLPCCAVAFCGLAYIASSAKQNRRRISSYEDRRRISSSDFGDTME